jgi:hypothetical protein
MPWNAAPLVTLLWLAAAAVLVGAALGRLDPGRTPLAAAYWMAALAASFGVSYSGGSAEAPLLLYVSAAAALLAVERPEDPGFGRWVAGIFLAGAVSTKMEGTLASLLLLLGTALRDRLAAERRPLRALVPLLLPPLLAGSLWLALAARFRLSAGSPGRGALFDVDLAHLPEAVLGILRSLESGTRWLSWALALAILLWSATRPALRQLVPLLVTIGGSLIVFLAVYLHEPGDPSQRIGWEMPRLSQPSLSLLIIAAAVASLRPSR